MQSRTFLEFPATLFRWLFRERKRRRGTENLVFPAGHFTFCKYYRCVLKESPPIQTIKVKNEEKKLQTRVSRPGSSSRQADRGVSAGGGPRRAGAVRWVRRCSDTTVLTACPHEQGGFPRRLAPRRGLCPPAARPAVRSPSSSIASFPPPFPEGEEGDTCSGGGAWG